MPHPRKRFGQHWLKDSRIHQAIVQAAQVCPDTTVLEIGPGTGQLTRRLLQQGSQVIASEIDRDLCQVLRQQFAAEPRFHLQEGDFLAMPLPPEATHVVANIPYNITGPILGKLLGSPHHPNRQWQRIVLMVQKEVAERITATPGQKSYGAMSVRIQFLASCEWICTVPPQAFYPPPKVHSAVIALTPRPYPTPVRDPHWLETLITLGFRNRRKTLANSLHPPLAKDYVAAALMALDRDPRSRGETLGVEEWICLSHLLPCPPRQNHVRSDSAPAHSQSSGFVVH